MTEPRYAHLVKLPPDLEQAWKDYKAANPGTTFNGLILKLLREVVCATDAPIGTFR